jgi:hypothetical protein
VILRMIKVNKSDIKNRVREKSPGKGKLTPPAGTRPAVSAGGRVS